MGSKEFDTAARSILAGLSDTAKFTVAKQVFSTRCLLSKQVRSVMRLFTSDDMRLDFAVYAWKRTYDLSNYYKVNDAFLTEESIAKLNQHIR